MFFNRISCLHGMTMRGQLDWEVWLLLGPPIIALNSRNKNTINSQSKFI